MEEEAPSQPQILSLMSRILHTQRATPSSEPRLELTHNPTVVLATLSPHSLISSSPPRL